jgi:hypothetical protein
MDSGDANMAMRKMVRVVVVGVNIDAKRAVIQNLRHPLASPPLDVHDTSGNKEKGTIAVSIRPKFKQQKGPIPSPGSALDLSALAFGKRLNDH